VNGKDEGMLLTEEKARKMLAGNTAGPFVFWVDPSTDNGISAQYETWSVEHLRGYVVGIEAARSLQLTKPTTGEKG
jgi:hypothetical protein